MSNFNSCTLVGNLTKDPEMKYTPDGVAITTFTIAVNRFKKGEVDFITIKAFKKLAEICGDYLEKGKKVLINGRLQINVYEKDNVKKYFTEIIANTMEMLSARDPESKPKEQPKEEKKESSNKVEESTDDIPF